MLVGKAELDNIKSLLKIRNKECTGTRYIYYLLLFLFAIDLISVLNSVFHFQSKAVGIALQPYANWSFVLSVIACLIYTANYRDYNYRHEIYPQSGKSAFISYSLFSYLMFVKMQAAALGLYLLQYGFCMILDLIKGNVGFCLSDESVLSYVGHPGDLPVWVCNHFPDYTTWGAGPQICMVVQDSICGMPGTSLVFKR